ncbi:Dual 3',5'-cyclic-AMP and -GMP phosphodiesterase 11 [Armadillidium nasatum]|uniref:Dual 3',5'-cyclic-AMP and-GMP phosphodiesterase 11 n=1 Tax=Armadillidium nasatum TaxID=96803 RepID=A0A5N5TKF2_9CRUS|nr:Dual 3',5'-cyclic-AMP and -GMP phosphodiesterase 11 [Armadillidium nasatum]
MLDILVQDNIPPKLPHLGREPVLMSLRPKRVYRRKVGRQEELSWSQCLAQMDNYIKRRISFDHHYLTQLQRQQLLAQNPYHQQLPKSLQQQQQEWFGKSLSTGYISEIRDENGAVISEDPKVLKDLKGADVVGVYYMYKGWSHHGEESKSPELGGVNLGSEGANLGLRTPIQPPVQQYDPEWARMEAWLDDHQDFAADYFIRKASRHIVDCWLVSHAMPQNPSGSLGTSGSSATPGGGNGGSGVAEGYMTHQSGSRQSSGATTPVRKISAHEFEKGGLLKPFVTTIDGTPTFLSPAVNSSNLALVAKVRRKSRNELKGLDERQLIFELVKDICNDLDIKSLCHKILQNVSVLTNADRCSLFLVQGNKDSPNRYLVSTLFDVNPDSTLEEVQEKEEIRIPWGSGIIGYVAEKGEVDDRFNQEIDIMTGYKTRSLLCMPITDSSGEVLGVAQVINKHQEKYFHKFSDEKVFESYLQFCGIGLKNAQLYERSQLEVKRNQVLLDLARIIFEEQSTIEQMVYRIMTHTQSLLQCERVQVLLVHEASQGSFSRVFDLEVKDLQEEDADSRTSPFESRFPINIGITGHVAATGETVNIPDAYEDPRFDKSVRRGKLV